NWTTGPLGLSAGDLRLTVDPTQGAGAFTLRATGKTAAWVSRFFDADAVLATTTTSALLPLTHDETIVQGGRRVDRRFEFDASSRTVRMTGGGDAPIAFPLSQSARDPIAMLFYLRTLPLASGTRVSLPLADNGRQTRVDVAVGAEESLTIAGRSWHAWKIEPRIRESVERRAPP